ncbi:MAG: hypothetical protein JWM14_2646 [Chitinophagaceae bacterium]|nr:hypothetical protein [Chitinophagaceae bacterium]
MENIKTHALIFILSILTLLSCNTEPEKIPEVKESKWETQTIEETPKQKVSTDTAFFDDEFALQPFELEKENLVTVKQLLGDTLTADYFDSEYYEDVESDVFIVKNGNSEIAVFNNDKIDHDIFYSAKIADPLPIFKYNIVVGMSKKDLKKAFPYIIEENLKANVFEFSSGEATSYVYLIFENGKLKQVIYWPYTG